MQKLFKIHASQAHKIMGRMGLTETQMKELEELRNRTKALTDNMKDKLALLEYKEANPELPATATTFLKEWYAGDNEQFYSKQTDKGNMVEAENIDFAIRVLNLGFGLKNLDAPKEDEYMIGTPDVIISDCILDVKSPWNNTTFQSNISGINPDYDWQGEVYMHLYDKSKFILFYGLQNTPPECNYDREVIFDTMPENERWLAYQTSRKPERIIELVKRVKLCRVWLDEYDKEICAGLGKLTILS